jgi:hypothetical protein
MVVTLIATIRRIAQRRCDNDLPSYEEICQTDARPQTDVGRDEG